MAPAHGSDRIVIGLSVAVFLLWLAGVAMAMYTVLALYPEGGPWRAALIAALVFLVAGFVALIAVIVVAKRGRT